MTANGEPSADTFAALHELLGPLNKTGVDLKPETRFSEDLNFDSLVVMEFVATVEDCFDISIPMNILPDITTVKHLALAVEKIVKADRG
ncbi:MAG: acyl carrier protein [Alphaproteobacteria bacterium]|jgi:acyl carrier protein|nr:acyl carrier protein [Alphaproteobacteria bacterium]PHY01704.1 MAG: phosphopantetheine-binding protein [Rhodospirillaceae bacterium]